MYRLMPCAALALSGACLLCAQAPQLPTVVTRVEVTDTAPSVEALTKLPGTLHETPRSLTILGAATLRERNFRTVPDLLNFMPGVTANSYRNGSYHFYARGYRMSPDDTRVDGMVGMNVGGGFGSSLFGVENVMVQRGPSSLVNGTSSGPGGMINLVTKKPQEVFSTRLDLRTGAYAGAGLGLTSRPSYSADLDSTGPLMAMGRIQYRLLATIENQNYFTYNTLDRNRYANGQLTFRLDRNGLFTVTPVFQYARFTRPPGGGIVASPATSLTTNDGISGPIYTNDLSSMNVRLYQGYRVDETSQTGFDFRGTPSMDWKMSLSYRLLRNDTLIDQWTPQVSSAAQLALLRDQFQVQRVQAKSDTDRRYHNIDFNVARELRGSRWKNTVQLGAFTRVVGTRGTTAQGTVPGASAALNIYTGALVTPFNFNHPAIIKGDFALSTLWNGYLQNRTSVLSDKLVFTLGLGYGQTHIGGRPVQKGDLMPNVSLVYNPVRTLALYGTYSTSFNPTDPTLENILGQRGTFNPTLGKNYEMGAKYDLLNRRLSATLALFRNEISNALVQSGTNDFNPNGQRYYVEAGSRQAKGGEMALDYRLRSDWTTSFAASYTSGIYTGKGPASAAQTLAIPGSPTEKTPRWSWNARTAYQRTEGRLRGLGASVSLQWLDQRLGSNGARTFAAPDPLMLPAYTRVDASLSYRVNSHWDWALNVDNAFDAIIFVNASVGSAMEMAPPRGATMRLGYRF
jgi:iron complex outermembrane recepter protein